MNYMKFSLKQTVPLNSANGVNNNVHGVPSQDVSQQQNISEIANELYRDVKEVLSAPDFSLFADNINKLNNGHQSTETTLQNLQKLLKDNVKLFRRLQNLIHLVEEEATS